MATTTSHPTVWPVLSYRDARGALEFLAKAFGFEERAAYAREDDPSIIEHAEMRWPLGGGVMFGSAGKDDSPFGRRTPGNDSVYVVCDDPDALFVLGVWALSRGKADKALAYLNAITPKAPTYPGIWRLKARAFEALGDPENAERCRQRGADRFS